MNRLLTIVAVLLASAGAWAGEVTTIITPNNAGTVQVSQAAAGQTCTITVTPASGYYLTVENLSAVTTLDGGGVQAPSRRGIDFSEEQLTITAKTPDADPSGVTTYEFTMPADESVNVELTAAFQTLIAINPSVSLVGWTYGEDPNAPVVRDNTGNGEETFTYALQGSTDYTTAVPENAGKYTVKATIAAAGKYAAGSCTADFEISKAVAEITKAPAAVANLVYTGSAQTLIVAGEATGGELQYMLGADGNYATTLPSASAAGKYIVYYKVVGDANHNDVAEASVEVTIGKAAAKITKAPAAVANLVYTGSAQTLIVAGEATGGELQYMLGADGNYATTLPSASAAGKYTVYYKVFGDANHNDVAEASVEVTIGKAAAEITKTPAAATNLVYTGSAQTLIVAGEATGGELQYMLGADGNYATTLPSASAAGKYIVYYKVVGDANHNDVAEASVEVTIGKAAAKITKAPAAVANLVYTGSAQTLIVAGEATGGELQYMLGADGNYATTLPSASAAGKYTVYYKVVGDANHNDVAEASIEVTIGKAAAEITKTPAAATNLVYTGSAQTLIVAGEATGGELQYKLGTDGNYAATLPSASAAGKYTVYYKVVGDANHNDVAEASVEVTIGKAAAKITKAPAAATNLVYTGSAQTLITAGEAAGGELQYKLGADGNYAATLPSASAAGKYTVYYKVFGDANHNDVAEASVEVSIDKASIIPEIFIESWEYGSEPNEPKIEGNLGEGDVTISYKAIDADEYTEEIPSAVGDYIVKVVIAETDNYYGAEATAEFSIVNNTLIAENVFAEGKTYATYYNAEEAMMLPEGVVAYVITGVNGNMLVTQALSYIPQNTPVLLEKNEMEVTRNDDFTDNLLRGASTTVDVRRVTDGVVYVLYDNQFVKSVSGSIPVGRAYLVLEKNAVAGARLFFDFSDLTGISIVKTDTNDSTADWYTLDGRKLQQKPAQNGLYINNGKKVAINNK